MMRVPALLEEGKTTANPPASNPGLEAMPEEGGFLMCWYMIER
jgi:hypothetical protein